MYTKAVFRCYHVLNQVKRMLERGDSVETITEEVVYLEELTIK